MILLFLMWHEHLDAHVRAVVLQLLVLSSEHGRPR